LILDLTRFDVINVFLLIFDIFSAVSFFVDSLVRPVL
jgi:hypothetical protein